MPVNKEELAKDLETPEYQTIVKETLGKKNFVIRTQQEETELLDRHKKDVIEKEIPTKIKEVHDRYDKDIEEVYGAKRNQDEKSYEFLKRVAKANVDEVTRLKEEIKKGDPSGTLQKQLQEAEDRAKKAIEERDGKIKSLEQEITTTRKSSSVTQAYAGIKSRFKKDLPPLFDVTEKAILNEVTGNSVLKDGVLYMANADGSIRKDTSFKEITVDAYLETQFKDLLEPAKPKGGTGSKNHDDPNAGKDVKSITKDNFVVPTEVTSKTQLMDYMLEKGLVRGTKQFTEIWDAFSKDLKAIA